MATCYSTLQTNSLSVVKYMSRMTSQGRFRFMHLAVGFIHGSFKVCIESIRLVPEPHLVVASIVFVIHRHYRWRSNSRVFLNAAALETCLQLSVYVRLVDSPMTVINDLTNAPSPKVSCLRLC